MFVCGRTPVWQWPPYDGCVCVCVILPTAQYGVASCVWSRGEGALRSLGGVTPITLFYLPCLNSSYPPLIPFPPADPRTGALMLCAVMT